MNLEGLSKVFDFPGKPRSPGKKTPGGAEVKTLLTLPAVNWSGSKMLTVFLILCCG